MLHFAQTSPAPGTRFSISFFAAMGNFNIILCYLVQIVMFPKDGTMDQFLEMAGETLGINAKRVFLASGDQPEVGFYIVTCI